MKAVFRSLLFLLTFYLFECLSANAEFARNNIDNNEIQNFDEANEFIKQQKDKKLKKDQRIGYFKNFHFTFGVSGNYSYFTHSGVSGYAIAPVAGFLLTTNDYFNPFIRIGLFFGYLSNYQKDSSYQHLDSNIASSITNSYLVFLTDFGNRFILKRNDLSIHSISIVGFLTGEQENYFKRSDNYYMTPLGVNISGDGFGFGLEYTYTSHKFYEYSIGIRYKRLFFDSDQWRKIENYNCDMLCHNNNSIEVNFSLSVVI